jgi:iron-sulfur cluster repair protein YtfE (RIC family)
MNPFEMLRQDHRNASQIIEALQSGTNGEREELFEKLAKELEVHTQIEEDHFYPALRQAAGADDLVDEGEEEHEKIRECLSTMRGQSIGDSDWMSSLTELKQVVEHHVHEEESEFFPKAESKVSQTDLERLAQEMVQEKEQLMSAAA